MRGTNCRPVLLSEVDQGAGDVRIIGNELSIKVGKAKKGVDILNFSGGRPACDAITFDRIHGQLARFDDHSKVFNLIGGEFAFFQLQVKV